MCLPFLHSLTMNWRHACINTIRSVMFDFGQVELCRRLSFLLLCNILLVYEWIKIQICCSTNKKVFVSLVASMVVKGLPLSGLCSSRVQFPPERQHGLCMFSHVCVGFLWGFPFPTQMQKHAGKLTDLQLARLQCM